MTETESDVALEIQVRQTDPGVCPICRSRAADEARCPSCEATWHHECRDRSTRTRPCGCQGTYSELLDGLDEDDVTYDDLVQIERSLGLDVISVTPGAEEDGILAGLTVYTHHARVGVALIDDGQCRWLARELEWDREVRSMARALAAARARVELERGLRDKDDNARELDDDERDALMHQREDDDAEEDRDQRDAETYSDLCECVEAVGGWLGGRMDADELAAVLADLAPEEATTLPHVLHCAGLAEAMDPQDCASVARCGTFMGGEPALSRGQQAALKRCQDALL